MADTQFDPNQHMSKVKGRDYLEVKWRIAWMRHDHPFAVIDTQLYSHEEGRAVMRAFVQLPDGGSATGWGSETQQTFENYIEKAETKAIGRALTALGYGTPGAVEVDDAEVPMKSAAGGRPESIAATAPQRSRIKRLAGDLRLEPAKLDSLIRSHTGTDLRSISKRQASGIIDMLEGRLGAAQRAS